MAASTRRIPKADLISKAGGIGTAAFAFLTQTASFMDILDLGWETKVDSDEFLMKLGTAAGLAAVTGLLMGALHLDNNQVNQSTDIESIPDAELKKIGFTGLPLKSQLGLAIHLLSDTLEGLGAAVGSIALVAKSYSGIAKNPIVNIGGRIFGTGVGFLKALSETRNMFHSCQRLVYDSRLFSARTPKVEMGAFDYFDLTDITIDSSSSALKR